MDNLAHNIQRQQQMKPNTSVQPKIRTEIVKKRVTKGEKLLWSLAGIMLLVGALFIVSNYAALYKANSKIENLKGKITTESKIVSDLNDKVISLSSKERIYKIAKEKGMELNEKRVKNVGNE
ncbi:cell division protein FtsL [Fictibacillus sp. Mic-4]|uniref:cell division protein FtsL n=1 Tax=Fictibacillus TaxID=1329200 RepID=UPI00041EB19E|nr:cell division protein FtsL [Fictibacillus gelatini]